MRYLFLLALGAQATRIARDGVVENIASTSRKHFGRRRVDLEVTGARLVVVTRAERVVPNAARYADAVVLIENRGPWCALGDYSEPQRDRQCWYSKPQRDRQCCLATPSRTRFVQEPRPALAQEVCVTNADGCGEPRFLGAA